MKAALGGDIGKFDERVKEMHVKYPPSPGQLNCLSQLADRYKVRLSERVDHFCQGNIYFKGRYNFFTKLQIILARLSAGYIFLPGKVNENI